MNNELYHYNHNHDKLGRFSSSPGGSSGRLPSVRIKIKKKEPGESILQKIADRRERKKEEEKERRKSDIASKENPGLYLKNKELFSTKELMDARERMRVISDIDKINDDRLNSKINKGIVFLKLVREASGAGADIYSNIDRIKTFRNKDKKVSEGRKLASRALDSFRKVKLDGKDYDKLYKELNDQLNLAQTVQKLENIESGKDTGGGGGKKKK